MGCNVDSRSDRAGFILLIIIYIFHEGQTGDFPTLAILDLFSHKLVLVKWLSLAN
jgi:hypothetical protein